MKTNRAKSRRAPTAMELLALTEAFDSGELWEEMIDAHGCPKEFHEVISKASTQELIDAIDMGLRYATPGYGHSNMMEWHHASDFLSSHPHFLLGNQFDEARVFHRDQTPQPPAELVFFCKKFFPGFSPFYKREYELLLRDRNKGLWHLFNLDTVPEKHDWTTGEIFLQFLSAEGSKTTVPRAEFVANLAKYLQQNRILSSSTVFNTLWTPPQVGRDTIQAFTFSRDLIEQIKQQKVLLENVAWRQLEEIVATLLAQRGFEVRLTKQTRDGGRDIIAVGEFFPGIKIEMAVEVTKQQKVGIQKVSKALYQNRHFPALMVATSGTFTADVIREQNQPDNRLRLILSDGKLLRDWIASSSKWANGVL